MLVGIFEKFAPNQKMESDLDCIYQKVLLKNMVVISGQRIMSINSKVHHSILHYLLSSKV